MESLIDAYAMIGEAMPRFDRLSSAFKEDANFSMLLVYSIQTFLNFTVDHTSTSVEEVSAT